MMKLADIYKQLFEMDNGQGGGYIDFNKIKVDKELVLVDTNDTNAIISLFSGGKMPLDKDRVMGMVAAIDKSKELPPLELDRDNNLKDGHHRYYAYKLAKTSPVRYITRSG